MDITTMVKTSVLAASLVLLTACSSGSNEVFEQTSTAGADAISDDAMTESADTTLDDERAQFDISDCGSLPVSTALAGNAASAPGTMAIGQLVSGRVDPESSTNEHYWSVELEPGEYHLVLDTESADGSWSNLSIGVADIRDSGEVELLQGDRTDYRARFHTYFSVEVARTMVVRIRGNNSAENYVFALFKNGTRVPSPFFSECPVINLLSFDTTETFVLPREENSTDYHWFRVRFSSDDYSINTSASITSASQTDSASCQVQYEFFLVKQFGQSEQITSIGSIDSPGPVVTDSVVEFEQSGLNTAWILVQNNNCELSVEFTLSRTE